MQEILMTPDVCMRFLVWSYFYHDVMPKYENAIELLKEIPGFSDKVVEDLVAEIGFDMGHFPSEKHLASWAGICPGNNESAGKKKAEESLTETSR